MSDDTKNIGDFGENSACTFLKHHGYRIIDRNYSNRNGEIDVIARKGSYVVFVEVKTRKSDDYGNPSDAVNFHKQQRIIKTAQCYIMENNLTLEEYLLDHYTP